MESGSGRDVRIVLDDSRVRTAGVASELQHELSVPLIVRAEANRASALFLKPSADEFFFDPGIAGRAVT
jgi:hypothetical protein